MGDRLGIPGVQGLHLFIYFLISIGMVKKRSIKKDFPCRELNPGLDGESVKS
jgi:hypothetical protein